MSEQFVKNFEKKLERTKDTVEAMEKTIGKTFKDVIKNSDLKEQIARELHGIKNNPDFGRKLPDGFNRFFEPDSEIQPLPDEDF